METFHSSVWLASRRSFCSTLRKVWRRLEYWRRKSLEFKCVGICWSNLINVDQSLCYLTPMDSAQVFDNYADFWWRQIHFTWSEVNLWEENARKMFWHAVWRKHRKCRKQKYAPSSGKRLRRLRFYKLRRLRKNRAFHDRTSYFDHLNLFWETIK